MTNIKQLCAQWAPGNRWGRFVWLPRPFADIVPHKRASIRADVVWRERLRFATVAPTHCSLNGHYSPAGPLSTDASARCGRTIGPVRLCGAPEHRLQHRCERRRRNVGEPGATGGGFGT